MLFINFCCFQACDISASHKLPFKVCPPLVIKIQNEASNGAQLALYLQNSPPKNKSNVQTIMRGPMLFSVPILLILSIIYIFIISFFKIKMINACFTKIDYLKTNHFSGIFTTSSEEQNLKGNLQQKQISHSTDQNVKSL